MREGGLEAIWNFSENSSDFVWPSVPDMTVDRGTDFERQSYSAPEK